MHIDTKLSGHTQIMEDNDEVTVKVFNLNQNDNCKDICHLDHTGIGEKKLERNDDEEFLRPKQRIGLFGAVCFGIGSIIGSGIFVSPTGALKYSGSVGMSLVMWTVAGILAVIVGLVTCELASLVPISGGGYMYIYKGIGSIPAFLFVFLHQFFIETSANCVLSLVFANYMLAPIFDECGPPQWLIKILAATMLLTLCITNIISVKFATRTQMFFTVTKLITISGIIIVGIIFMAQGRLDSLHNSFEGTATSPTSYAMATYSCFFALGGANKINQIAEEIVNPKRNIPLAIIISVLSVTVLYVLVNLAYFTVLSKSEFIASPAIAYDWALIVMGPAAFVMPILVALSCYGALVGGGFAAGRVWYAAARNGHFPEVLSYLQTRTLIPVLSIISVHFISAIWLIPGNIFTLINFVGFATSLTGPLLVISLLRIRSKTKTNQRGFRVPALVLAIAFVAYMFLIVAPFLQNPKLEFLYGIGLCVVGLVLYVPFVYFKLELPGYNRFVVFCQLLLQLCPTAKLD